MMSTPILEIAVFSVEAAVDAINAGADRIEFCENPLEGGTTPSFGSLSTLIKVSNKSIFPIIRPRGGDFLYSKKEFEAMRSDVLMARKLDYPGVVIGLLNADGTIDTERTKRLPLIIIDAISKTLPKSKIIFLSFSCAEVTENSLAYTAVPE